MYAGDCADYFPDNTKDSDLSWMSLGLNEFYRRYLYPNRRGTTTNQRNQNDVLYCPMDEWHRLAETGIKSPNGARLGSDRGETVSDHWSSQRDNPTNR